MSYIIVSLNTSNAALSYKCSSSIPHNVNPPVPSSLGMAAPFPHCSPFPPFPWLLSYVGSCAMMWQSGGISQQWRTEYPRNRAQKLTRKQQDETGTVSLLFMTPPKFLWILACLDTTKVAPTYLLLPFSCIVCLWTWDKKEHNNCLKKKSSSLFFVKRFYVET